MNISFEKSRPAIKQANPNGAKAQIKKYNGRRFLSPAAALDTRRFGL